MKEVLIDCGGLAGTEQLHDLLARELEFPQWYGKNFDALYDCLTSLSAPTHLTFRNLQSLGRREAILRQVLTDAEADNLNLIVTIS